MKPSTRAYIQESRKIKNNSWFNILHGYVYARWIYLYIAMGTGCHPLAKKMAPVIGWIRRMITRDAPQTSGVPVIQFQDTYHGKVVPLQAARELVSVKEDINLGDLEKIVPYALARDIVLKNPDHIVVLDCPCRTAHENPCLPLDVCLVIGEPFAGLVLEHHPDRARAITSEEAQAIIKAEDERGHVHHAFFKDAMLGRFYAICNCCSCCCAAMGARRNGTSMLASSGFVAKIDLEKCRDCGMCAKVCPFDAISQNGKTHVDPEICMGCGVCVGQCHHNAIQLVRAESRGEPLEIGELIRKFQESND